MDEERARLRGAWRGRRARRAEAARTHAAWRSWRCAWRRAGRTTGTTRWTSSPTAPHPTKRFRPIASGAVSVAHGPRRRHAADRRRAGCGRHHGALADRGRRRHVSGGDVDVQRDLEAHRGRRPRRHRIRIRAPGGGGRGSRRRPDVELVRAVHHVRLAVHRDRQAVCRIAGARRGCSHAAVDAR